MNRTIDISGVEIRTERLLLRAFRQSDLGDFFEYASVDGVGQMAGWLPHKNLEESQTILDMFISGKKTFAVEYNGKLIGSVGIEEYNEKIFPELYDLQGREVGYVLSKEYWGRGIMPEAVKAVIKYLFEDAGLDFIVCGHFNWNRQSARVIEKCGFRYVKNVSYETRYETIENSMGYILYRQDYSAQIHGEAAGTEEHFMADYEFADDESLVQEIYRRFDEGSRLTKSRAAQVEFLTTVKYIERYLHSGARILDIGAGTGEYSLYFSRRGYQVSALELSDCNIEKFRSRLGDEDKVELTQGNALDLSMYEDSSFDVVLVFGPLYHLHSDEDKQRCISEAKRVCRPDGKLFFAFISNDMVFLTMFNEQQDYFSNGAYDKESFRLTDFPFVFHTVDRCREVLRTGGLRVLCEVAADGASELMQDKINLMGDKDFSQYMRYHYYICEKPEFFGMSNHLLFVCEKEEN